MNYQVYFAETHLLTKFDTFCTSTLDGGIRNPRVVTFSCCFQTICHLNGLLFLLHTT